LGLSISLTLDLLQLLYGEESLGNSFIRFSNCGSAQEDNVLLTVCRGNIVRLWLESPQSERFQFTVCSVIEPGPLGTVVDFMNARPSHIEPQSELPNVIQEHSSKSKTSRHATVPTSNQLFRQ
jgi:hypothetical protein